MVPVLWMSFLILLASLTLLMLTPPNSRVNSSRYETLVEDLQHSDAHIESSSTSCTQDHCQSSNPACRSGERPSTCSCLLFPKRC